VHNTKIPFTYKLPDQMNPRYSLPEIERRWLAIPHLLPDVSGLQTQHIQDRYLDQTRMRLRKMTGQGEPVYKLCKKYGKVSAISEPITNIYLSASEYQVFAALPGKELIRERFTFSFDGVNYSINRLVAQTGPIIVEAEFASEAAAWACLPPPCCGQDISHDPQHEAIHWAQQV